MGSKASKCGVLPNPTLTKDPIAEILPMAALQLEDIETNPEPSAHPEEELEIPVNIDLLPIAALQLENIETEPEPSGPPEEVLGIPVRVEALPMAALQLEAVKTKPEPSGPPEEELGIPVTIEILPMAALQLEDVETEPEASAPVEEELGIPVQIELAKGATEGSKESLNAPWDDESSDCESAAPTVAASDVEDFDADNLPESDSSDSEPEPEMVTHVINDLGPPFLIDITADSGNGLKLMVIVSMVNPFWDSAKTLIHAGDFLMEVTPTTTIREIKKGMIDTLEICYEDMALIYVGKFLSDARTVEYYMIEDGQSLHLLVESPNKLFKHIFNTFKQLELSEEKAWFATRAFIQLLCGKYSNPTDDTSSLTDEQLLTELSQLCSNIDVSDVSSAEEEDDQHLIIHNGSVMFIGGTDIQFITNLFEDDEDDDDDDDDEEDDDDDDDDDTPNEVNEADDQGSEDEEDEDLEESSDDEDLDYELETPDEEEEGEESSDFSDSSDSSDDEIEKQGVVYKIIEEYPFPPLFKWN